MRNEEFWCPAKPDKFQSFSPYLEFGMRNGKLGMIVVTSFAG